MTAAELAEHFEISDAEYKPFCDLLHNLEFSGDIVKIKQKQYADPEKVHLIVGTLDCNSRGFGFVVPVKEDVGEDVYVNEEDMGSAMHGDLVVVRLPATIQIQKNGRGKRGASGQIVNVLKRVNELVVGTFEKNKTAAICLPPMNQDCSEISTLQKKFQWMHSLVTRWSCGSQSGRPDISIQRVRLRTF